MQDARIDRIREFVQKFGLPETHTKQIIDGNVDVIADALIDAAMANAKRLDILLAGIRGGDNE